MSGARGPKTRTAISEYVKRAVVAYDGNKCSNCGVQFLYWGHLFPFDLDGSNSIESTEPLCPSCSTSKWKKLLLRSSWLDVGGSYGNR
jgi:5-methylcytosine-specific restriction endonuclease McrA